MALTIPLVLTPNQLLSNTIADYKAAMYANGYLTVNVDPGSDQYLTFKSVCDNQAIFMQGILLAANANKPTTATGDDLDAIANAYGVFRKSAGNAVGFITFSCSAVCSVPLNATLVGTNSLNYAVTQAGVYSNGALIPVAAINAGTAGNLPINSILTWNTKPAFATTTAVAATQITGGSNAETDAALRNRLQARFANPPQTFNFQDIIDLAVSFSPRVASAFVYNDYNGPGTTAVALVGYQTNSDTTRVVPTADIAVTTSGIFGNISIGLVPGLNVTTIASVPVSVAFQLSLPLPSQNTTSGWLSQNPWPFLDSYYLSHFTDAPHVLAVTDTQHITVRATATANGGFAPTPGITTVAWIDWSDDAGNGPLVKHSNVTAVAEVPGSNQYVLTLDTALNNSLGGVQINDYIFPASVNDQTYLDNVLSDFAGLGPGEKTNNAAVMPFALRQPLATANQGFQLIYPSTVNVEFLKTLEGNPEVATASFAYNFGSGAPALPNNINNPPNMYTPKGVSFFSQ